MSLPTAKELKSLAKACRPAGITQFEGGGIKFTLADFQPTTRKGPLAKSPPKDLGENSIESDSLSDTDMLFWSCPSEPGAKEDTQ